MVASNFTPSPDMVFGESNIVAIVVYSVMFVLGLTTNSLSLYQLVVARFKMKDRTRMTLLMIHLSVADLLVRLSNQTGSSRHQEKIIKLI